MDWRAPLIVLLWCCNGSRETTDRLQSWWRLQPVQLGPGVRDSAVIFVDMRCPIDHCIFRNTTCRWSAAMLLVLREALDFEVLLRSHTPGAWALVTQLRSAWMPRLTTLRCHTLLLLSAKLHQADIFSYLSFDIWSPSSLSKCAAMKLSMLVAPGEWQSR